MAISEPSHRPAEFRGTRTSSLMSENKTSFKEQFSALKNIPALFRLIWRTNRALMLGNISLRILRAFIPLSTLFIGKEIVDEVVKIINNPRVDDSRLWLLVGLELGIVILSEIIGRGISLTESLLGDLFANQSSIEIIKHAATLDLYQFEDPQFYDKLERARRQTTGRTILMTQVFEQCQDIISILVLGAGLIYFNAWLILILVIAVLPSLFGEIYFNQKVYSLTLGWTPQRRELDYLRYIGASDETAKEVKTFGLADFLVNRFKNISDKYYHENKSIAVKRAVWGAFLKKLEPNEGFLV